MEEAPRSVTSVAPPDAKEEVVVSRRAELVSIVRDRATLQPVVYARIRRTATRRRAARRTAKARGRPPPPPGGWRRMPTVCLTGRRRASAAAGYLQGAARFQWPESAVSPRIASPSYVS